MSRWVIIAGLAIILISLVALATLSGGSNPASNGEEQQETAGSGVEAPETTEPTTTPTTAPEPESDAGATTQSEDPVQGIREDEPRAQGNLPLVATVEVSGDARYSCSVGSIDSPRTVRGRNPASYQVRVSPGGSSIDTVMAVCQKISGDRLGVGIIYDQEVKVHENTTNRFGTVSVSWSPVQE